VVKQDEAYCQPCLSPVWDTALAAHALMEAADPAAEAAAIRGLDWLRPLQVLDVAGDWAERRPDVRPGGWAFQYRNDHYPDLDDTAVVVMAMDRARHRAETHGAYDGAIDRGAEWVVGLQSRNGGWGAFDVDNDQDWLNRIPYGDLKAMIDPATADVSARVLEMVARCKPAGFDRARFEDGLTYLLDEQEIDGAWFGRWGVNYVYGTSGALAALGPARADRRIDHAVVRGAVWLRSVQNADGGWGETTDTYKNPSLRGKGPSTASQTAWALIGLLESVQRLKPLAPEFTAAIERGVDFLIRTQRQDGNWDEPEFTGTGFPVHFYLNYHQYRLHFPL
jgi:squalene-hopene/tetraprenyl-beta-curcumene cyclase